MHLQLLRITFIIILSCFSFIVQTADKQQITLALITDPNTNLYGKWGVLIYNEAFSRLNINGSYIVLPALRASNTADSGKIDGEMGRGEWYAKKHPNLIRIEEPLFNSNLSAFVVNPSIKIQSWDDIKAGQYKVEYYRGIALAQQRLTQRVPQNNLTDSSNPINSLRLLQRGRIDIYIGVSLIVNELLVTPEFIDKNIHLVAILEEGKIYGYLHHRHEKMASKLAETFQQMKSEGLFNVYLEQARQFIKTQDSTKSLSTSSTDQ